MFLLLWIACEKPPTCPEPPAPERVLSEAEAKLLAPYLDDLRQGVRRHGDQGFGVCQGKRTCDTFLGPEPAPLAAGDYLIRAELDVPELSEGWKVAFHIDCTLTTAEGRTTTQTHDRTYDVRHVRTEVGYRLQPLWMIQSPHPNGTRSCTYSLTPLRPDGSAGEAWNGRYTTPAPDASAPGAAPAAPEGKGDGAP